MSFHAQTAYAPHIEDETYPVEPESCFSAIERLGEPTLLVSKSKKNTTVTTGSRRNSARSRLFMIVQTQDSHTMWAWDLSLGGLQCRSKKLRFPGERVAIRFALPGNAEVFNLLAEVTGFSQLDKSNAHGSTCAFGLRFIDPSDTLKLAIYQFLDQRRLLWDADEIEAQRPQQEQTSKSDDTPPFVDLLRDAYGTLRLKELQHILWPDQAQASVELRTMTKLFNQLDVSA